MCMISYFPQNVAINETGLRNGAVTNDDGHGFAIASRMGIHRFGSMNFDATLNTLREMRAIHGMGSAVVFHSRYATHGTTNEANIHPFWVTEGETVMAHNGILPNAFLPATGDARSDTRVFVDNVARHFCATGIPSRRGARHMAEMIGDYNKLVFLTATESGPRARIVNSRAGIWDGGAWYSNSGYTTPWWRKNSGVTILRNMSSSRNWWNSGEYTEMDIVDADIVDDGCGSDCGPEMTHNFERDFDATICYFCEGRVDLAAGMCTDCQTCQDCYEDIRECMCFVPEQYRRPLALGWND